MGSLARYTLLFFQLVRIPVRNHNDALADFSCQQPEGKVINKPYV